MKSDEPGFTSQLPGLSMDARTGTAPGSAPSRTAPPDEGLPDLVTGVPNSGVVMPLAAMTGPGEGASPQMPGQTAGSVIMQESNETASGLAVHGEAQGFTNTGAGDGHNLADQHRYPWQQAPGRTA